MSDTVDALVRLRAENDPAIPTVIDPTDGIDYAELDAVTHRLAAAFVDHGVGNGNRVGHAQRCRRGSDRRGAHPDRRRAGAIEHPGSPAN
jgi:non-ribosomal peptide synthetase component F